MRRACPANAMIMLAAVLAACGCRSAVADGTKAGACLATQPESRVESVQVWPSSSDRPRFVTPEELSRASAGSRVVDVRRRTARPLWRPDGALAMSLLELRVLASRSQDPVYVFGSGYDDERIVGRIARWKASESGRVRVVRFGAAGMAVAGSSAIGTAELQRLLAIPVRQAVSIGRRANVRLVWFGSSVVPASMRANLPGISDSGFQSVDELVERLGAQGSNHDRTIVLAGDNPARVGEAALKISGTIGRPVFYVSGDRTQIGRQMDRQAQLVQGRRRVGGSPCG